MRNGLEFGKLIFLHGASSSGKSTIAKELQMKIEEPFWHYSIDHFRDSGILPMERYRNKEFIWSDYRDKFFKGYHYSIQTFIKSGNNLILEHIIETIRWKQLLQKLFIDVDVYFVGVHCNIAALEEREKRRGNRPVGSARKDFETIHQGMTYDLELEGTNNVEENTLKLLTCWKKRRKTSAFHRT